MLKDFLTFKSGVTFQCLMVLNGISQIIGGDRERLKSTLNTTITPSYKTRNTIPSVRACRLSCEGLSFEHAGGHLGFRRLTKISHTTFGPLIKRAHTQGE